MLQRLLKLPINNSFFIFGPRGVGKSTLIKRTLPQNETYTFDLLDYELTLRFNRRPGDFRTILDELPPSIRWIFIDEVQKVPFLLNEVHHQIETNPNRYFAITGSSARKLKRGEANLLAGRAFAYSLFPMTSRELGENFNFGDILQFGSLPKVFSLEEEQKKDFLRTYALTYLKEEVQAEGLVRQLPSFQKFLLLAAQTNGNILSWGNMAQDIGVDAKTIKSYYSILEETLIGFLLPAYHRSLRKRQRTHPKFYFFDTGVQRALAQELNLPLIPGSTQYGRAFEHFWIIELMRLNSYYKTDFSFSYLATDTQEIDLVIERPGKPLLFIEIKSSEMIKDSDIISLRLLLRDNPSAEAIVISSEPYKRKVENILICPWEKVIEEVFQ